jgi:hypothetical protein
MSEISPLAVKILDYVRIHKLHMDTFKFSGSA